MLYFMSVHIEVIFDRSPPIFIKNLFFILLTYTQDYVHLSFLVLNHIPLHMSRAYIRVT